MQPEFVSIVLHCHLPANLQSYYQWELNLFWNTCTPFKALIRYSFVRCSLQMKHVESEISLLDTYFSLSFKRLAADWQSDKLQYSFWFFFNPSHTQSYIGLILLLPLTWNWHDKDPFLKSPPPAHLLSIVLTLFSHLVLLFDFFSLCSQCNFTCDLSLLTLLCIFVVSTIFFNFASLMHFFCALPASEHLACVSLPLGNGQFACKW